MKEYILVEFIATNTDRDILVHELNNLENDFLEIECNSTIENILIISGKISAEYASVIKLQNPFLSERMRISYIQENLKDKYRK